jgi:hypothetical protein
MFTWHSARRRHDEPISLKQRRMLTGNYSLSGKQQTPTNDIIAIRLARPCRWENFGDFISLLKNNAETPYLLNKNENDTRCLDGARTLRGYNPESDASGDRYGARNWKGYFRRNPKTKYTTSSTKNNSLKQTLQEPAGADNDENDVDDDDNDAAMIVASGFEDEETASAIRNKLYHQKFKKFIIITSSY